MEPIFAALSKGQSMLLLTAVTFGGQDALASFSHLPAEEEELLKHRAQQLLALPRDRRIPVLVGEMKRLVTVRRGQLWSTEPERLAGLLQKERPALIEVVLRALPAGLAETVREFLPLRQAQVKLTREVRPEVLNLIRWKLEEQLSREGRKAGFKFSDVVLLRTRELVTLADRLGARALSMAINGLPDAEQKAFFGNLHPDQRTLLKSVIAEEPERKLPPEEGRALLALHEGAKSAAEILRSAGAQRLARACIAQSPEYAQRVVERNPGEFGLLLARWIREERPRVTGKVDAGRAEIVADLERLSVKGVVERPVRLPTKRNNDAPKSPPEGRPLPPPPERIRPPESAKGSPEVSRRRDLVAEREARRAGLAAPANGHSRDPIAEREARRAGAARPATPFPAPTHPPVAKHGGAASGARERSARAREDEAVLGSPAPDPTGSALRKLPDLLRQMQEEDDASVSRVPTTPSAVVGSKRALELDEDAPTTGVPAPEGSAMRRRPLPPAPPGPKLADMGDDQSTDPGRPLHRMLGEEDDE